MLKRFTAHSYGRCVIGFAGALTFSVLLIQSSPTVAQEAHAGSPPPQEKVIMGWLETVFLLPTNVRVVAKLDTGAKTSSVHARSVEHFTLQGKEWVRFRFQAERGDSTITLERPLVRTAVIKERQSSSTTRDVVMLAICKNGHVYETEFTLNDRSNFNYPILLGRSFLENVALVDAGETFLFKGDQDSCESHGSKEKP
jgi:hypothetical protein